MTSDVTSWALQGWFHLTEKYWPEHPDVVIGGYSPLAFPIPTYAQFISVGNFYDYPIQKWSDGLIKLLEQIDDECFVWTMDDFWPIRPVNNQAIQTLFNHAVNHRELARIDLSRDRQYAKDSMILGKIEDLDIVGTPLPSAYLLSLQTGIWRRSALKAYLVPGETAWQVELEGTSRMNAAGSNVIGTLQEPTKYLIAVQKGKLSLDGGYQGQDHALPLEDVEKLRSLGYLP
jgi:hypothetical protein